LKRVVIVFGLISGAVSSSMMLIVSLFVDRIGFDKGWVVGYTGIVLSLSLVFFGIKAYRDGPSDGRITFTRAFAVGILITLISCVCYVVAWEVLYYNFLPHFMDDYGAYKMAKAKASGASSASIEAQAQQLQHYREMYANPLTNAAVTFIEPFPIGFLVTIVSAAILRRKVAPVHRDATVQDA
jgi:Protein of unknown function (DUF4199)